MRTICKILMALAFVGLLAEGDDFTTSLLLKAASVGVLVVAGIAHDALSRREGDIV